MNSCIFRQKEEQKGKNGTIIVNFNPLNMQEYPPKTQIQHTISSKSHIPVIFFTKGLFILEGRSRELRNFSQWEA